MQYCYSQCKPLLKQDASGQATHIIKTRHAHNNTAVHNNKLQQTATSSRSSWSGSAVISPTITTDVISTSKSSIATSASSTADANSASDVIKDEKESIQ
jgi:hypothetical protein